MKKAALIVVIAFIGASIMAVLFLPLCIRVTQSAYCMPPVDWLIPLFVFFGSKGGAPGTFEIIWLEYFVGLLILFAGAIWIRRKYSN